MPQFIIDSSDIEQEKIVFSGSAFKHVKSLRISYHETVTLLDEHANQYTARLAELGKHQAVFQIIQRIPVQKKRSGILLAQAVIKNEKMNMVLQKATELGVDGILPFISRYTVVKIKNENFIMRSNKIIQEAVGQSMRQHIPELFNPTTYQELITSMPMVRKILFHYGPGIPPLRDFTDLLKQPERIMLIIGPEGGFSGDELQYANDHKVVVAGLGNNVLRAETAAIAAICIASFVR